MTLNAFPPSARRAVAMRVLDMLTSDDLPDIALELLPLGTSTSAAVLAGATPADTPSDRAELFDSALSELELTLPSKLEAARFLTWHIANDAITGAMPLFDAAEQLMDVYYSVDAQLPRESLVGSGLGLEKVLGLYWAFDDVGTLYDRATLERELREALEEIAEVLHDRVCRS